MNEAELQVLRSQIAAAYASRDFTNVRDRLVVAGTPRALDSEVIAQGVNAALQLRDLENAIAWLGELLARQPDNQKLRRALSMAHNNRGVARRAREEVEASRADYEMALIVWPQNTEALFNLSAFELEMHRVERARTHLAALITLLPQDSEARLLEVESRLAMGDEFARDQLIAMFSEGADAALTPLARCKAQVLADTAFDAGSLRAPMAAAPAERIRLATLLCENGRWRDARNVYADLAEDLESGVHAPGLFALFGARLALPAVFGDRGEFEAADAAYLQGLAELEEELTDSVLGRCEAGLKQARWSDISAAHRIGNLRESQTRLGRLLTHAGEKLARGYVPATARPLPRRPRIGLVGQCFRDCAGGAYFGSWVRALAKAEFETHLFHIGSKHDALTDAFAADADFATRLDGPLDEMAVQIASHGFDLLIYPELGSDHLVQALATLRLAPRQACAWGVPVTSGLPHIDTYFSCQAMEPDDAASHYSERLVCLPHIGTRYRPPALPRRLSRGELGLPDGARLYFAPHMPTKLHIDGDAALAQIAARDPCARIVLFRPGQAGACTRVISRISRALELAGAEPRQLLFLPPGSRERYLQLAAACDVMMDCPHWSGGNSTLDCLLMNLPVVTIAGNTMRGRQSTGMLSLIGLDPDLVCDSGAKQLERVLEVAADRDLATRIRGDLAERVGFLMEGDPALRALQGAVRDLFDAPAPAS